MIKTYKHFKRANEIFFGLGYLAILQLGISAFFVIWLAFSLKLALNSPITLVLASIWAAIAAFIIKASQEQEIQGHYSSLVLHPFEDQVFKFIDKNDGYQNIKDKLNISEIKDQYLKSKSEDIFSILKLDGGISFHKYTADEKLNIIYDWGAQLSQLAQQANIGEDYFLNSEAYDSIQIYIKIKPFQAKELNLKDLDENIKQANQVQKAWYKDLFEKELFIPDLEFYLIIKAKNPENKNKVLSFINAQAQRYFPNSFKRNEDEHKENEKNLYKKLKQRINNIQSSFNKYDIAVKELEGKELKAFYVDELNLGDQENGEDWKLEDKSDYIKISNKDEAYYNKIYRLKSLPKSGELNFWLLELIKRLDIESSISLHIEPRNANYDRRQAETKITLNRQLKNKNVAANLITKENQEIIASLLEKPSSFDFSLYVKIKANNLKDIQDFHTTMMKPIEFAQFASLERLQTRNWLNTLPFANNKLSNREKHFADLDFISACYPFIKSQLGTQKGPFLGISNEDRRPVYLDEYDRSVFNNRGINFIGDSGSGKTVCAKLAVKRRMDDEERKFFILDNTIDGWEFFVDYYSGKAICVDKPGLANQEALFSPFEISNNPEYYNDELEGIVTVLKLMSSSKSLSSSEKRLLLEEIKALYKIYEKPCLSDLYRSLEDNDQPDAKKWLDIISPFCYAGTGIYASLADGRESAIDKEKLVLFSFSKIHSDSNFLSTSLYLITNFISQKVHVKREAKITFIVDEAWKIFNNTSATEGKELIEYLARAGRGLDLGLWTISQKPSDLSKEVHSCASASLCFQLKEKGDRELMSSCANLNSSEKELLDNYSIKESGVCLLKTTRSSDLVNIKLDPLENILTNSTRDYSNKRSAIFKRELDQGFNKKEAAFNTVRKILELSYAG